jgi:hypothetical protein
MKNAFASRRKTLFLFKESLVLYSRGGWIGPLETIPHLAITPHHIPSRLLGEDKAWEFAEGYLTGFLLLGVDTHSNLKRQGREVKNGACFAVR